MARIGFRKVYAPSAISAASFTEMFALLKAAFVEAGFTVLTDTATVFEVIPLGVPVGTADDETPHWSLRLNAQGSSASLYASPVHGTDLNTQAISNEVWLLDTWSLGSPSPEFTLWFAADGREGWWWLHGSAADPASPSGLVFRVGATATRSRRYPSDRYPNLCARYGLRDMWGSFYVPYAIEPGGLRNPQSMPSWSPLGAGTPVGRRHPGSPLPKMAVPVFPSPGGWLTALIMGELEHVLILTDGYANLDEVVPGWIAFVGGEWDQPYAVPAPPSFTVK